MHFYRIQHNQEQPSYAATLADARAYVRERKTALSCTTVELVDVATDKASIAMLINGLGEQAKPLGRFWIATKRGGLQPISAEEFSIL